MSNDSATISSMQTIRVLAPEEFDILTQAPDKLKANPQFVTAVVAERDGKLLGRRFLCLVPHVEGAWQLPEADVEAMERVLTAQIKVMGLSGVMRAAPVNEDLTPFGYEPLPLLLWAKRPEGVAQ